MNQTTSPPYLIIKTPIGNRLTIIIKINNIAVQARVPDSDINTLRSTEFGRTTKASLGSREMKGRRRHRNRI
jgi:hypothetical protein